MRYRDLMLDKLHLNEDDALHALNALLKSIGRLDVVLRTTQAQTDHCTVEQGQLDRFASML